MRILAIETSCDETAICLMEAAGSGADLRYQVLGNALLSQAALHARYGGVFPNLAKREHQQNLVPILAEALHQADALRARTDSADEAAISGMERLLARETDLAIQVGQFVRTYEAPAIDAIAVTQGPGLEPALWVGINLAKALAYLWQKPIVPVNHLEGHIAASALATSARPAFPAIALLVSGGHTELVSMRGFGEYERRGSTRDDAAGECFDKCARLMGLPYPGGPEISRLAAEARTRKLPPTFALPRPMIDSTDLDFSFSGLKTAVRRAYEKHGLKSEDEKRALAREIEDAIADVLVHKTMKALDTYDARSLIIGGGVSANAHLRAKLSEAAHERDVPILFPPKDLATDNAIMIALVGCLQAAQGRYILPEELDARGNLPLAA